MERLKQLLGEVEAVVIGPDDEPKDGKGLGDDVIGTLPAGLKKLVALMGRKHDQIKNVVKEGIHLCDVDEGLGPDEFSPEHRELHAKVRAAELELEFLGDLLWALVRLEFPGTSDKEKLVICAGFELVARKGESEPNPDLRQFLGAMGIDFDVVRVPVGGTPQILVPGSKARN